MNATIYETYDNHFLISSTNIGFGIFQNITSNCCNIRKINFNVTRFSDDISRHLGEFIRQQTRLHELKLSKTDLTGLFGRKLFENLSSQ